MSAVNGSVVATQLRAAQPTETAATNTPRNNQLPFLMASPALPCMLRLIAQLPTTL